MKRQSYTIIVATLLVLVTAFTAVMCSSDNEEKVYKVGLSQCADDTQWRKQMTRRLRANAVQEGNIELIVTNADNSSAKQVRDIDSLSAIGIDILLVSPNDVDSITDAIRRIHNKGIPVIEIDRKTSDSTAFTCFIGASNFHIGIEAAKLADNMCPKIVDFVELFGQKTASATIERSRGFNEAINKKGFINKKFNKVHELYCNFSGKEGYEKMKKLLETDTNFNLIYSHNDDMAIGASKAIREKGIKHKIYIIGIDAVPSEEGGILAVVNGEMDKTILYPNGSDEAIATAMKILKGEPYEQNIQLSTFPIDTLNAFGLYKQLNSSQELDEKLIKQDANVKSMTSRISTQHNIILLIVIMLAGALILSIIIMRLYANNKKQNTILCEQTAEILAQKEELESQSVYLSQINEALRRSKENTLGSIRYAQTIQSAMLPTTADMDKVFKTFVIYMPKDIVSGDFYYFHSIKYDEREVNFISVIDCTGHGVPGAFMSLIGINLLDQIIKQQFIHSPAEILDELNRNVRKMLRQEETDNDDGMEAIFCKIEKLADGRRRLTYEGAKFPVHRYNSQTGEIITMKTSRKGIGGKFRNRESSVTFTDKTEELNIGDRLYMTSDGIGDQNNYERKRYTIKRLLDAIKQSVTMDIDQQKNFLLNDLNGFKGDCDQRDDITVLGIEIV
ncbi:MAG: substrate-binding domain-containing protein [Bacteroidales bacterium]|nr:substrate-binding domain-containing protein [Bacteroidales bacterium]